MATSVTLGPSDEFPSGTSVAAYKQVNWPMNRLPPSGSPIGSADATGTISSAGTVTLTGLTTETDYFLYGSVSGESRYIRFTTREPTGPIPGGPAGGDLTGSFPNPAINPSGTAALKSRLWINVKDYGAKGDGATDDKAAFQAAIDAADAARQWGAEVFVPGTSSYYLIGSSITPADNVRLRGEGRLASRLYLKSGVNSPIIDSVGTNKPIGRYELIGLGFRCEDPASHSGAFPLVKLAPYYSIFEDLYFDTFFYDGLELAVALVDGGGGTGGDRCTFNHVVVSGGSSARYGIYLNDHSNFRIRGGGAENCDVGVYYRSAGGNPISQGQIEGFAFENNRRYSYYSEGGCGVSIRDNYIFDAPIGLDRGSNNNVVRDNTLLNSEVYDGGRGNIISPNHGRPKRISDGRPLSVFFPASLIRDPDFSSSSTAPWTAVGGAGTSKTDTLSGLRMYDRAGKLPLAITGAAGKGGTQDIVALVAGETYLVELYWWSNISSGTVARAQLQLLDAGSSAVLYNSGNLTRPYLSVTEWSDVLHRTVFQVPAGTTSVQVKVTSPDAGTLYQSRVNFIKLSVTNGGMEGAYSSGVAPDWTKVGTGTATEEGAIVRSGLKAQRAAVTSGQSISFRQDISELTSNPDCLYLLRGDIYVVSGGVGRAILGIGDDVTAYQRVASARMTGMWETVSTVLRPSGYNRAMFGLTSSTSAAEAIFDDITFLPLKDAEGTRIVQSREIDLTAASTNYVAASAHRFAAHIRRIWWVYSTAASAQGPTVRVGINGNTTYYGSFTPAATQAVGDTISVPTGTSAPPTHTDLRPGVPVIVTHSGAAANGGKGHLVVEYE